MTKYYLHDGQNQAGPFTIEELKAKDLSQDTQVWKEGTPAWVKAESLEELKDIFLPVPPPLPAQSPQQTSNNVSIPASGPSRPKNRTALIALLVIVIGVAVTLFVLNRNSGSDYREDNNRSYEYDSPPAPKVKSSAEAEQDLASIESENPVKYLVVKGATFRRNLIGEVVLEGSIKNKAKVAAFKDVVIEAEYLSISNTVLDTEKFTKYETWQSGSEIQFKFKTSLPTKEVKQVRVTVVDAVALQD